MNEVFNVSDSYLLRYTLTISVLLVFLAVDLHCMPYLKGTNVLAITFNITSILVLLSQGLVFEGDSEQQSKGVLTGFTIFLMLLGFVVFLIRNISILLGPKKKYIRQQALSHLSTESIVELYVFNSMLQIEARRDMWLNLDECKKHLPAGAYDDLKGLIRTIRSEAFFFGPSRIEIFLMRNTTKPSNIKNIVKPVRTPLLCCSESPSKTRPWLSNTKIDVMLNVIAKTLVPFRYGMQCKSTARKTNKTEMVNV
eukprot:TRINITY_DN25610_c0_g1_i2.p1 TRINITY_DN25610_c0_g1~~TRINITY_DN25610_c0_g1_i2.p1  ORF type:complete len:253 (+),score=43.90 TRINITY_DN25610_c0_g1_i2:1-759(+)